MKSLFLSFLVFPSTLFSQIGVGVFKINQTKINIVDSISLITGLTTIIQSGTNYLNEAKYADVAETRSIIELKADSINYSNNDARSFVDTSIKVFYINYFKLGEFPISNIYLTFYKNILVGFSCKHTQDFINAFKYKYGDPSTQTKEKIINCQNGYGAVTTFKEIKIYYNWLNITKNISASALTSVTYNEKCEPFFFNNFSLHDDIKLKQLEKLEKKYKDSYEQRLKQNELNKLKDF